MRSSHNASFYNTILELVDSARKLTNRRRLATFSVAATLLACLQIPMAMPGKAETWRSAGNWVVSGSPRLRGCSMATRYPNGAFLSITAVSNSEGRRTWEILVSSHTWTAIQNQEMYPVGVRFSGSSPSKRSIAMTGFKSRGRGGIITNALIFRFLENSEFMTFLSAGLEAGSYVTLDTLGAPLGSFALSEVGEAFDNLRECLKSAASNYEA